MARRRDGEREGYWRELIQRQQESDVSVAQFCRDEGISVSSIYYWRRRLAERPAHDGQAEERTAEPSPGFMAFELPAMAEPCELLLANGRRIRVPARFDERALASLIAIAEGEVAHRC